MSSEDPRRDIPPDRQAIYYSGLALSVIGILLFLSTFVTFAAHFGDFQNFEARAKSDMFRAFGGMALIFAGLFVARVGKLGAAGSGLLLDPRGARRDVEPWNRMAGGMVSDALDEVTLPESITKPLAGRAVEVVKVRCRGCQALNDETDRYCGQCGAAL